MFHLNVKMTCI